MPKRKRPTEEFKIEAVRAMLNRGTRTIEEVAKSLGVNANLLYSWRERYLTAVQNPTQHAKETAEQIEIRRLRKENEQLRMEREILEKATVRSTGRCNTMSPDDRLKDRVMHAGTEARTV